jgi:ABC-2 type transport system ATP-binding protein
MKRRVMIAKALSHDPELLFLDEPTAGVDVELRRDMWRQIGALRKRGTTIVLTTHYIEEAQEMADRVGVINKGKLLLVVDKAAIMAKLGRTEARIALVNPLSEVPATLAALPVVLEDEGGTLVYRGGGENGDGKREAAEFIKAVVAAGLPFEGIVTKESTLEDIFVDLVEGREGLAA